MIHDQLHQLQPLDSPSLVTLSVVLAMIASYAALDVAGRVRAASGRVRAMWIAGGAVAMGSGIWTMHFVGMDAGADDYLPKPIDPPRLVARVKAALRRRAL